MMVYMSFGVITILLSIKKKNSDLIGTPSFAVVPGHHGG